MFYCQLPVSVLVWDAISRNSSAKFWIDQLSVTPYSRSNGKTGLWKLSGTTLPIIKLREIDSIVGYGVVPRVVYGFVSCVREHFTKILRYLVFLLNFCITVVSLTLLCELYCCV